MNKELLSAFAAWCESIHWMDTVDNIEECIRFVDQFMAQAFELSQPELDAMDWLETAQYVRDWIEENA